MKDKFLQLQVHKQVLKELIKRIVTKPKPTAEELFLGCYIETLEPQVRYAVRLFNRKGYTTWSSGFYGKKQGIDGFFTIDLQTKHRLKYLGVDVIEEKNEYTTVSFVSQNKSLTAIKKYWDLVAAVLPKKKRGQPADNAGSELFRKSPLRDAYYVIGELEHQIALEQRFLKNKR